MLPTPVAIIGIPGGLEVRHDQLKELVKAGTIAALVAQDPYSIGELGVRYGVQYLKGKHDFAKHYGTGEAIITKDNVDSADVKNYLYSK